MSCVSGEPSCLAQDMISKHATLPINEVERSFSAAAQSLITTNELSRRIHSRVPDACHEARDVGRLVLLQTL